MQMGQRVAAFAGALIVVVGVVLGSMPYTAPDPDRSMLGHNYEADCRAPWLELMPDGAKPRGLDPITWEEGEVERDLTPDEWDTLASIGRWQDRKTCGSEVGSQLALPLGVIVIGLATAVVGWFIFRQ